MNPHFVFCIAFSSLQADQITQRLKVEAFATRDISMLSAVGPMISLLGDISQGLLGQGVPWVKARHYASRIREGRTLVAVQAWSDDAIQQAREIFRKAGANDICATNEGLPEVQLAAMRPMHLNEDRLSFV